MVAGVHAGIGDTYEELKTTDGMTYKECTVTKIEPDGLTIIYSDGAAKLPYSKLSTELQQKYAYDSRAAEKYTSEQAAKRKAQIQTNLENLDNAQQIQKLRILVTAKPPKDRTSTVGTHMMRVSGRVLQVLNEGLLLASNWKILVPLEPYTDSNGVEHSGSVFIDEPLFIVGPTSGYVDGSTFTGVIYPAGAYQYNSVLGAKKTVCCYAMTENLAIQRLIKSSR